MLRQLLLAGALLAAHVWNTADALGTNYNHDGVTTYCWAIPQPPKNTKLNETDRVDGYSGKPNCPMIMTVTLSNYTVAPLDVVNVTWTVSADFSQLNAVNMTKVVYGPDSAGNPAQIVHSNVHSCVFGTGCDPFSDGEQLVDKTTNKIANLSDNHVTFSDTLRFSKTGDYSILAHIIMPDSNASRRFDYAVYTELVVKDATPAPATVAEETPAPTSVATSSSSGLSSAATIGIIVGGVVLVVALIVAAVILRRRKNNLLSPSQDYMAPPAYDTSVQLLTDGDKKGGDDGRGQSEQLTDTSTTAGFQSAWSGPVGGNVGNAGGRPSQNLDGTGASNVSGSSHASSSYVINRDSQMGNLNQSRGTAASAAAMYRDGSVSSSAPPRPRRVDSDVEL